MKKYDLILVGIYIIPVVLAFVIFYALNNPSSREIKEAETYFKELYKQPVKTVVIYETNMYINVFQTPEKIQQGFKLTGAMALENVKSCRIVHDTLFMSCKYGDSAGFLKLQVSSDVKVDTLNAPLVNISKAKVEGNTTTYEF